MYMTGFADEAADSIEGQIRATKEIGWENIESRNINGKNIHDITDAEFDVVYGKLQDAGVKINCFGSAVANWAKQITDPFDSSLEEARRAIPRMKRLGTKLIRIMSFAVLPDREPEDQMKEERFSRLRTLVQMFGDEGIQAVHENCMNFGGMGYPFTLELIENVPGLKLVFDTGNPVFNYDRSKPKPWARQSSWEFYSNVRPHIAYIHIKDGYMDDQDEMHYTFAGEGKGDVRRIIKDLIATGYNGGISMEPHLGAVFHDGDAGKSDDQKRYDLYVDYSRRMDKLIEECRAAV